MSKAESKRVWAQDLINKVDEKWRDAIKRHPLLNETNVNLDKKGYAVFYSPVVFSPTVMLLGLNPGGGDEDFDRDGSKLLPMRHEYLAYRHCEKYSMAGRICDLFEGKMELLEESVKANLIFFEPRISGFGKV